MPRYADDSGIVAARSQDKREFAIVQRMQFKHRTPACDLIALSRDNEHWEVQVAQRQSPARDKKAAFREIVVKVKPAQILDVHAWWQPRSVRAPGQKIIRRVVLAKQI